MPKKILQQFRVYVLSAAAALAQTLTPAGDLSLSLDHARFQQDKESGYFEVYYSFLPSLLTFEFAEGKYQGGVHLATRILNRSTNAVVAERQMPLQISEADTSGAWFRYPFITQAGFQLPMGPYRMEVSVSDTKSPTRKIEVQTEFEITPFPAKAALSDLELCKKVAPSQSRNDLFYKNTLEVVPQPSALFGVTTSPVVFHYAELYELSPAETYFLKTQYLDGDGNVVFEKSDEKKYTTTSAVAVGNKMVTSLPTGKYTLRCLLLDAAGKELSRSEKVFYVLNPHVKPPQIDARTVLSKEMESFTMKQLDEEFQQLRYLTSGDENKVYAQVTSLEGKREFLLKVWQEVEQGRGDKPAVARSEYKQRIKLANSQFGAFGKEGWRTDRGRVFLLYGTPDERQRFVAETGSKGHEIWKYFQLDSGVEFIFIDRTGYGDFQLVHSTKRGELKDNSWESLLQ